MRFTRELLDTLLSSFDSKETLLKWLKKLERAINDANVSFVESVVIENNPVGDAFRVGINFAGGESIYSNYFKIEDTFLTQAQIDALNSGIDATKVTQIETNSQAIVSLNNAKQDALTQEQLNAINSGIDDTKVAQIGTNSQAIVNLNNTKQDALTQEQMNAVNSGINANKVLAIENKVDKSILSERIYGTNSAGGQTTYDKNDFARNSRVIYDASSSDTRLNWGYPTGISNNITVTDRDFSEFKYLICFTGNSDNHVGVIVNLINNYGGYGGRAVENAWKENGLVVDIVNISINSAKTSITPTFLQIWDNSDFTLNRGAIRTIVGVY